MFELSIRCYVHLIVCHACVGLRFDMPLIKRILIDWLIERVNMMSNSNYSVRRHLHAHQHQETVNALVLGTRRKWPRPRRWQFFSRRDRDETLVRLETETSRPRPQPCYILLHASIYESVTRHITPACHVGMSTVRLACFTVAYIDNLFRKKQKKKTFSYKSWTGPNSLGPHVL